MLLEATDLDAFYGPSQVLHGCAVDVSEGECVALLGRNGVGKTTLVHTLAGLHAAKRGTVSFEGRDITHLTPEKRFRRGITLVPQGHRIFRSLTVAENLSVALRPVPQGGWQLEDVFDRFPILTERADQEAGSLSGGQQQMLAVGRAMLGNGRLMLMDEPSEGLDPQRVALMADIIKEVKGRGTSVLLVEQRVAFALKVAERVAFMVRGEIAETLPAETVRRDASIVTRNLGLVGT